MEGDGIEPDGYKKISLDEILSIAKENGGELKFTFARQTAPYQIEIESALLHIGKIIDEYGDDVKKIILDILQWGDDKFSFGNEEKRIFVIPQMLYSKSQYPIAAVKSKDGLEEYSESMRKLKEYKGRIGDIYLDVDKISKMIKETGLEYMKRTLDYLIQKGKVTTIKIKTEKGEEAKDAVNISDFWGLATLYYIGETSKDIFGIDKYEIKEFKDKIKLANGDEFDISGYELTFKYKEKELKFRVYDASHIYKEEAKRYGSGMNSYITLALYSGSGYILLEGNPEREDQKIREFYQKARDATGYDILILLVDEQKLIERGIIGKEDYVKFIDKDKTKYIIDTIKEVYKI